MQKKVAVNLHKYYFLPYTEQNPY